MKKIIAILTIAAVLFGAFLLSRQDARTGENSNKIILTENQLEPYLNIRGWDVTKIESKTIKLPQNFTGNFKILADKMEKSGLKLNSHKGENVKIYTFSVNNYGENGIIAEMILTENNELISAALIQLKLDGFIKAI